ncbi:MAG TPA: ABC transporter ATP-binding protein [Candidatus Ozemobacteraceae bacterium]|nr:ABC transporter ATP-binding protein [Candidatus Ozemobacteraceae bacterium]
MNGGALAVENLCFSWPCGRCVLDKISFNICSGERVALIGPNGAGKSTLLLHLNGLLPDGRTADGSIRADGFDVAAPHLGEVRRRVGIVFQDPDDQLFCETVGEDVAYGPSQLAAGSGGTFGPEAVSAALATVGLDGFADRPVNELSRGEKRRAAIAGVLACEPSILVLDEPTGDLDPRGRRQLTQILKSLCQTLLIVTHDLEWVRALCGRAILIDDGRVIADGPIDTLLADEPLMLAHGLETPASLKREI